MSELRPHEMSYGEISELLNRYREVMDALYGVVVAEKSTTAEEAVAKYRTLFPAKQSTIQESVNFVVDMMNSGAGNPDQIYPRNRYHGD